MLERQKVSFIIALTGIMILIQTLHGSLLYAASASDPQLERVAILRFWAFDQEGNVVPQASESDLARLASVLPQAIAARLVQSEQFHIVDEFGFASDGDGSSTDGNVRQLDRVKDMLTSGYADQVIIGNIAQIQQSVVTSVQRYVNGPDGPHLEGAAVVRSNNAGEAVNSIENVLTQVFPPDTDIVPRPIARFVIIPNVLRIPVGGHAPIQAYAVDDLGRTISTVSLVFQTNDETRAVVDDEGIVTGVSPGRARINLKPLGRALASNVTPPEIDVTVVGPNLGLRAGSSIISGQPLAPRVGLRLTPAHEIRTSTPTQSLPQDGSNPVNVLTSFFASLIGNQMLTVDLDIVPSQDMSMTLNAVQRTARSYFGTGIGVAVPLHDDGQSGVILRLTIGGQLPFAFRSNMTHPIELNADFILGGGQIAPQARIGVSIGLDLFQ